MVDNQHRQIAGYRELSPEEIALMNRVKEKGGELGKLIGELEGMPKLDQRWVAIARTRLQEGIMAAVRAIAQPTTF